MKLKDTIVLTDEVYASINEAKKIALSFENNTGKQINITGILGEVIAAKEKNLKLIKDDLNEGFDAYDKNNEKVQIKTRRFNGNNSAQTGKLLDNNFNVPFDYALLVLLNKKYELIDIYKITNKEVESHFERINNKRVRDGKKERKTMSISQFIKLANSSTPNPNTPHQSHTA